MDSGIFIVGIVFGVIYINELFNMDRTDMFFSSVDTETLGIDLSISTIHEV